MVLIYTQQFYLIIIKGLRMKKFSLMLILLAGSFLFVSCDDDDDDDDTNNNPTQSIVQIAQGNNDLSILVEALIAADLVSTLEGNGPFTVLAPTNTAFANLLASNDDWDELSDIPTETLRNVLLYHVISGKVMSTDLTDGYVPSLSLGAGDNGVSIKVSTMGDDTFNTAGTINVDIEATNGVIHTIDEVILPPNMVDAALANSDLSTLVAAISTEGIPTDFLGVLANSDVYTVFAPTNAAFGALLEDNDDWNALSDIPLEVLNNVLLYHVVNGNNVSGDLSDGQMIPTLFPDASLTVNIDGSVTLTTGSGQTVNVSVTDIQTTNGVYHVVDAVLLP